ncbi:hypothetical protein Plav_1345 [Parvibaculum lavamentivorans DS-1]|uniref:Uncharacterized protein n=1 Tax=Parvibaculum lavamentivorans (strain DS-1 / DSM 13023 / NCIMB 13966) TaxID=402881 RepID=A7HST2_PARL1|nr:hypothetical protein Plav_1345 [Parvibaculum lavamentivorans DS-1]
MFFVQASPKSSLSAGNRKILAEPASRRRAMTYLNSKLTNRVITLAIAGYTLAFLTQIAAQYAA